MAKPCKARTSGHNGNDAHLALQMLHSLCTCRHKLLTVETLEQPQHKKKAEETCLQQLNNPLMLRLEVCFLTLPIRTLQPVQGLCSCQAQQRQGGHLVVAGFVPHIHQQAGQACANQKQHMRQDRHLGSKQYGYYNSEAMRASDFRAPVLQVSYICSFVSQPSTLTGC